MHSLALISPLIAVILLAMACAYFGFFSTGDTATIVKLVFYIIVPILIFISLANIKVGTVLFWPYIFAYFLASLLLMLLIGVVSKLYFHREMKEIILNLMGGTHTNSVYLALPLFLVLFRNATPVISIIILQNFITVAIVTALEIVNFKNHANLFQLFKNVFAKNPLIIAAFLGFILSIFQVKLPLVVNHILNFIAEPGGFLALFALGLSLLLDNKRINTKDVQDAVLIIISKSILHPLMAFILGKYLFHLNNYWLFSLILMCMMPAAKNIFIFAKKYNVNSYKYNWIVVGTTFISLTLISISVSVFFPSTELN